MRILHLLSQIQVTGAETYATTLADAQIQAGNDVWIISDTLHAKTEATYLPQPLHTRTFVQRIKNVIAIRCFVKKHNIDVVHAHSRASIWVGYFAVKGLSTPLVSTIHGRQKPSVSKRLFDFYGDKVITVCSNAKTQLEAAVKVNSHKITVIPNAVNFTKYCDSRHAASNTLTIAGRTTGPKGQLLADIITTQLEAILQAHPGLQVQIIGGALSNLTSQAQLSLRQLQQKFPNRIVDVGFVDNLTPYLQQSSCVIAAGRIAIETIACQTPLIAMGEALCVGLVDEENLSAAMASNFGDMSTKYDLEPISLDDLLPTITEALLVRTDVVAIAKKIEASYPVDAVKQQIMALYRSAIMQKHHPKHIPVLMYHKVLPEAEESQHKVFVTCEQFQQHMQFLSKRGFTPITFKDYFSYSEGRMPLTHFPAKPIFITFDDGYKNNLTNALPVLQQFNFKCVLFALGNDKMTCNEWDVKQGEPAHALMVAKELAEMSAAGVEIGAHTLNHPDLTHLSAEAAFQEIVQSKENLEAVIGDEVISFAYPYGYYNDVVRQLVVRAGFKYAVATDTGGLHLEDDHFRIFRVNIMPRDNALQIWKKTRHWYRRRYWHKRGK